MNIQDAHRNGFKTRITQLILEEQTTIKQAGMWANLLGAGKKLVSTAPRPAGAGKILRTRSPLDLPPFPNPAPAYVAPGHPIPFKVPTAAEKSLANAAIHNSLLGTPLPPVDPVAAMSDTALETLIQKYVDRNRARLGYPQLSRNPTIKQAGMLSRLFRSGKIRLDPSFAGLPKIKLPNLEQAIAEQQLAQRQVGTAALQNRAAALAKAAPEVAAPAAPATPARRAAARKAAQPPPRNPRRRATAATPVIDAATPAAAPATPAAAPLVIDAAAPAAAQAPRGTADLIGRLVGGLNPGLGRRVLAGPEFASASSLNPADLGRRVLGRAGVAGGGAALAGGSYVKGQMDAAEEAKRRAAQLGFMQRLAFLLNPNIVNQL